MHTGKYSIPGYKSPVVVIHNGDWSGNVKVIYREKDYKGVYGKEVEVEIPGLLFVALSKRIAIDAVTSYFIRKIEQFDYKEL